MMVTAVFDYLVRHPEMRLLGVRPRRYRCRAEILLAVDAHVLRLLAREHGVGLRAGRDQDRARRQDDVARALIGW
jgi:hypothetical protein